ncbi:MAG: M24 family metallopeptidase, partial [Parcubacteria group bacterium]
DLENNEQNKKLIEASRKALENAIHTIKAGIKANQIGKVIEKTITSFGATPIINLSGHQMMQYELHAGNSIPNIDDNRATIIEPGLYAIEPFASTGIGKVHDGKPSGIYMLENNRSIRGPIAREILEFIKEEYRTLPFCSRWLVKRFGTKALIGLKQLEENGNLHHFAQLVETSGAIVAQSENTVLVEDKTIITTE